MNNASSIYRWEIKPIIVIVSTIVVFIGVNTWVQKKTTNELKQIQNQALTDTADSLANNLTSALVIDDYANIEKRIEEVINERDYIQSIILSNQSGVQILKFFRSERGQPIKIEYPFSQQKSIASNPLANDGQQASFSKRVAIKAGPANLGELKITSWKSNIETRAELIQRTIFLSSTISLFPAFIVIFYYFLTRNRAKLQAITEDKNKQLTKANIIAENANAAKSEFLSRMTHELRTPMNAVLGLTHLAMQAEPENRQLNYLKKIEKSGNNLLTIINDILDFNKIEAGKLTINKTIFNLADVIDEVVNLTEDSILKKGIEFIVIVDHTIPGTLWGDSLRLTQVLVNLLSNAAKFTEKGTISLRASAIAINSEETTLEFAVEDTGIGIATEQIKLLFQDFQQAELSTTRRYGGTGLGLSICKHLMELMDGSIEVRSRLGEGSCFIAKAPFGMLKSNLPAKPQKKLNYRKALVIAEQILLRDVLSDLLLQLNIQSLTAKNVEDINKHLRKGKEKDQPFDLILTEPTSFTALEAVIFNDYPDRPSSAFQSTNIILMGSPYELTNKTQWSSHRINAWLNKPVRLESLRACLNKLEQNQIQPETKQDSFDTPLKHDQKRTQLKVLLVEDNPINEEICRELLKNVGINVFSASNGEDALNWLHENTTRSQGSPSLPCDVILMDLDMPVMNGWECTEKIRKNHQWANLPILAMSAHAMEQEKNRSMAMGFQDYITKPFHPNHLYERIEHWSSKNKRNQDQRQSYSIHNLSLRGVDTQQAIQRLGGNHALYKRMLKAFVQTEADNANKLAKLLSNKDWEEAKRILHTMKGLSHTLGLSTLADISEQLEKKVDSNQIDNNLFNSYKNDLQSSVDIIQSAFANE